MLQVVAPATLKRIFRESPRRRHRRWRRRLAFLHRFSSHFPPFALAAYAFFLIACFAAATTCCCCRCTCCRCCCHCISGCCCAAVNVAANVAAAATFVVPAALATSTKVADINLLKHMWLLVMKVLFEIDSREIYMRISSNRSIHFV